MQHDSGSGGNSRVDGRTAAGGRVAVAALLVAAAVGACGGSDDGGAGDDGAGTTTTTMALAWSAQISGDHEVPAGYRQGLARDDGWVFSTNDGLYRTDDTYAEVQRGDGVIPAELAAQGYDHVGDVDIADGVLWAPLERADKDSGRQVIARYDPASFAFLGSDEVAQHHAAFVAVDGDDVYSMDEFDGDDTILRYRWDGEALAPVEPLVMDRMLERVQGGDVADGALWLSTDDARNGVYRVDLATGAVTDLGSAGREAGEGEGIDATELPSGLLHVLVADPAITPMWVVDMTVLSQPG